MACTIRHIDSASISNSEKERLSQIYRDIFKQAKESKAFREVNNRLQVIKKDYNAATTFVSTINSQYGAPVSRLNSIGNGNAVLSVNVLPLSNEKQVDLFLQKPDVDFELKSSNILASDKAIEWFKKRDKAQWKGDLFWQKLQQDLQIPKEQIDILKSLNVENPYNREELLTSLLANYSYTVEINTAKKRSIELRQGNELVQDGFNDDGTPYYVNADEEYQTEPTPTQHYSNLTVPGGTNYTENEIKTPNITPSIKGHAQFSTDNGIGWFRSDDKYPFTGFLEDLIASGTIKKVPCG